MYSTLEFTLLEKMENKELREEIEKAKNLISEYQEYYKKLEEEMYEESPLLAPDLGILFSNLKNIEGYIRKAENLLGEWDTNRYIDTKRKNRIKLLNIKNISNIDVGERKEPENRELNNLSLVDIRKKMLIWKI